MWRQLLPRVWRGAPIRNLGIKLLEAPQRQRMVSDSVIFRGIPSRRTFTHNISQNPIKRSTAWRASHLSTDTNAGGNVRPDSKQPAPAEPTKRRIADDLKEYKQRAAAGNTASFDLIAADDASVFPRIKTTSLSTKRIVIHDEALKNSVTLVLVAFRSFADDQLQSWKSAFFSALPQDSVQWYDVTINESFGAQALSGFIQRLHRSRTDPSLHDYYVAFNSKAREPLEALLPSQNRMFGYVLLLDRQARVRFRASGMASDEGLDALLSCAKDLISEEQK